MCQQAFLNTKNKQFVKKAWYRLDKRQYVEFQAGFGEFCLAEIPGSDLQSIIDLKSIGFHGNQVHTTSVKKPGGNANPLLIFTCQNEFTQRNNGKALEITRKAMRLSRLAGDSPDVHVCNSIIS